MNLVGYVLVMAPVLAKMWRIYYIFHNPLAKKKVRENELHTKFCAAWYMLNGPETMVSLL